MGHELERVLIFGPLSEFGTTHKAQKAIASRGRHNPQPLTPTNFLSHLSTSIELNHPKSAVGSSLHSIQPLYLIISVWPLPPALLTPAKPLMHSALMKSLLVTAESASERHRSPILDSGSSHGCPIGAPLTTHLYRYTERNWRSTTIRQSNAFFSLNCRFVKV